MGGLRASCATCACCRGRGRPLRLRGLPAARLDQRRLRHRRVLADAGSVGRPGQDRPSRCAQAGVRLYRAGELTFVAPPTPEQEGLRDLVRCRDDLRRARTAARHRVGKQLLRYGGVYPLPAGEHRTFSARRGRARAGGSYGATWIWAVPGSPPTGAENTEERSFVLTCPDSGTVIVAGVSPPMTTPAIVREYRAVRGPLHVSPIGHRPGGGSDRGVVQAVRAGVVAAPSRPAPVQFDPQPNAAAGARAEQVRGDAGRDLHLVHGAAAVVRGRTSCPRRDAADQRCRRDRRCRQIPTEGAARTRPRP